MKKSSRKTKRKGTVAVKVIAPKKFATGGAVSFDFDDTLSTDLGLQMAKSNPSSNKYVISARSEVTPDMIARARQAGIPDSNIFATGSDEAKVAKIQELGIKKHLDNKKSVIDRLGFKGQLFENGGNKKGNPPYKSPVQIVPYYSFNQPTTPEEWVKSIDQIEKIIGNPSTWTQDDYNIYQNKLNEYKIWRETTPEGQAVVDSSKRPNEYVIPLPTQLSTYLTSEQNRILQENPELQFIPKSKFAFGMPGAYGVTDEVGYAYGGYSGLFRYADGGTEGEPIENPPIYTWEGDPNSYYRKDEKGNWRYLNKDTQSEFASGLYAFDKVRNRKVKKKLDAEAVLNPNAEAVLNQWGNTLTTPEISEVTLGRKETRKERKEREARYQAMTPEERRIFDQRKEQMKEEMWRRDNPNLLANNFFNDPSNMTSEQLRQMAYKVPFAEAQKWLDMAEVQARREGELRTNKREKDYFQMGMSTMHGGDYLAPGETYASTYNKLNNFKTSEELPYAYAGTDKSGNIQLMTQEQKAKNDAQLAQITAVNEALKNRALIEQIEGRKLTDSDIYGEDGNYNPNLAKYSTQEYLGKIDDQKYQNFLAENQKAADEAGILYNSMDFLRNLAVNFPSTTINLLEGKMPLFQQGLGLRSEDPELRAMYEGYMPAGGTDTDYWFNFINPVASLQEAKISYDLGNYGNAALAGLGALPLIGAVGKGTAKGIGILDDAYRAAMSKSDEFARSFNLADEAPESSYTFTQSTDDLANLADEATTSVGARNNPTNFYDEYLFNENVNLERIPEEDLMTAFSENPNATIVEAISPTLPGNYTNLNELLIAQDKAFSEGVDISNRWALADSEKYFSTIDEASKMMEEIPKIQDQKAAIINQRELVVQKSIEDFMQSKGLLEKYKENPFRTDIPHSFFIEFHDDLMKNPDYVKLTDEINSYDEAIKQIEVSANQKIVDAEQYVDPIFKEKVQNLYNLAGQNAPELANIQKDIPIFLQLNESDPLFSTLSKEAQDYIRKNRGEIYGTSGLPKGETVTLGSIAGDELTYLSTPKDSSINTEIVRSVEQKFLLPEDVRATAVHEGGHAISQKAYNNWVKLVAEYDPMYLYYVNHSRNDIAKEFKRWMVDPTLPVDGKYTTQTWKSGIGELHSELMAARAEVVSNYVKKNGMSIDEAVELVKKQEAEGDPFLFEYYLNESPAELRKHFKPDTPDQIKKQLIQILPAGIVIAGTASGISMAGSGDGSTTNTQGYKLGGSHKNKYIGLFRQ